MNVVSRAVKAAWDEVANSEIFLKGDDFEKYVRSYLFPKDEYAVLPGTNDRETTKIGSLIENNKRPVFKFRSNRSRKEFFVEAKYRSGLSFGAVEWCEPGQFNYYKNIDNETPVYIVIGLGQEPGNPERVFFIPMSEIKFPKLFHSFLKQFEVVPQKSIDSRYFS